MLATIAALRLHCPWTRALTHEALVEYLVEESYEVVEAIEEHYPAAELRAELGDVLLQVVLHARIAQEHGRFDFADVAAELRAKMVRRNPHVFRADGTLQDSFPATIAEIEATWHSVKKQEKPRESLFSGIPAALPALAAARKSLDRAGRAGLPVKTAWVEPGMPRTEEELGELLFAVVAGTRNAGLDPERALRRTVARFQRSIGRASNG